MRTKFKPWAQPYIEEHPEVQISEDSFASLQKGYVLEIGAGKGGFLYGMSTKFPNISFIGVERNVTCCGFICKKLVENEIKNAKLYFGDFERVSMNIPDESVSTIFLNFSDPWPKKRHNKRRLTAERFINEYYRILQPKGKLIIKTDNKDLFDFSVENLDSSKFLLLSKTEDYKELDGFDCITEYEASFREEGLPIYRIVLEK